MNPQTEINNLRFAIESLIQKIDEIVYRLDIIEAKLPNHVSITTNPVKKNKKAVYTAIFGAYDRWEDPKEINPDWDYYLFTDQEIYSSKYQIIQMEHNDKLERKIKIVPHQFKQLADYDVLLWHDGSIKPVMPSSVDHFLLTDFTILKHPSHNCVYREAEACLNIKNDNPETIKNQISRYKSEGMPQNFGMVASGINARINSKEVQEFTEKWWQEVSSGSRRDQLSFNYCLWKYKPQFNIKYHPFNLIHQKDKWKYSGHLLKKRY